MDIKYYQVQVMLTICRKLSNTEGEFEVINNLVDDEIELEKLDMKLKKFNEALIKKHKIEPDKPEPIEAIQEWQSILNQPSKIELKADYSKLIKNITVTKIELRVLKDLKVI